MKSQALNSQNVLGVFSKSREQHQVSYSCDRGKEDISNYRTPKPIQKGKAELASGCRSRQDIKDQRGGSRCCRQLDGKGTVPIEPESSAKSLSDGELQCIIKSSSSFKLFLREEAVR